MNLIRAIIIDDEEHNRNVLQTLLNKHCPTIDVVSFADSADTAFNLIRLLKPQLIFLDIKMPEKSGFDLLKMFPEIDFEVIFVSAFNEFAITAFEFNALGYILKPVDYVKLEKAVDKAIMKIVLNHHNNDVFHFIKTLENNNDLIDKISIHNNDKVVFINIKEIISVEANNGICEIKLVNNTRYISNKDLKLFDEMLENIGSFIRVNRSVVINAKCIKSYTKGDNFNIEMIDGSEFEVSRRKKTEVLSKLKNI